MENRNYEITISKEEYDDLKLRDYILRDIISDIEDLISNAKLSWNNKDLIFEDENIQILFKRHLRTQYLRRVNKLKEDKEKKDNE